MTRSKATRPRDPRLTFATFLAPEFFPLYQLVTEYVGQQLDRPTQLLVGSSFSQLATGGADLGFICGYPYVQLTRRAHPPVVALAAPG